MLAHQKNLHNALYIVRSQILELGKMAAEVDSTVYPTESRKCFQEGKAQGYKTTATALLDIVNDLDPFAPDTTVQIYDADRNTYHEVSEAVAAELEKDDWISWVGPGLFCLEYSWNEVEDAIEGIVQDLREGMRG